MTYEDIFLQILHEVTNKPKTELLGLVEGLKQMVPDKHKLDDQLPDNEGEQVLDIMRTQKEAIRAMLIKNNLMGNKPHVH